MIQIKPTRAWFGVLAALVLTARAQSAQRIEGAACGPGRQAGDFHWVHNIAIDSQGSVYTSEVDTGKRAQRFLRVP